MDHRIIGDRFEIERLVGSGGMGEVFRAKDRLTGGPVAVKVLYGSMARDADRFKRESTILAEISHPRIVKYVAHGLIQGGRPYLVMEWLEGEDLADRLEVRGLTLHETLLLARRVSEALAMLHDRGIVHRDIKPSNIYLPNKLVDEAKVLDLGVARNMRASRPSTRTGIMVGTPGYMAPEQARGAKDVDARADIFALGCLLYECLAGRPAFAGENIAALLAKILLESPPSLREIGIDIPFALDELMMRMLSKHPGSRPANGAVLLKELDAFVGVRDAPAQRASAPAQRALTAGERKLVCVVMAAFPQGEEGEGKDAAHEPIPPSSMETMAAHFDPRSIVASFGAEAEILADGSIVVTFSDKGGASDQAAHAARCALALRSHLMDASVVLATGLATVTGRSAVGEVLERAAAILATARARVSGISDETLHGQSPVFLDETTAGLLDLRFDVGGDDRGLFIRGLRERDTKARTLLGKPTPFVGRDRELSTLMAIFDECVDEPVARAVLVTGFPGAGKSRLVTELLKQLRELPDVKPEIWLARGDAMSEGSPFALLARLLRRGAGIHGGEPLVVRQQKLRARIARHVREEDVGRVAEFLGEMSGIPFPDNDSVQLRAARQDAILMGDQMRRAFCDLVVAEAAAGSGSEPRPTNGKEASARALVLVIEDLHWGDLPSVNVLDAALRAATDRSFMVLAVARGDVHDAFPQLWAQRSLQEVRLGPLVRRAGEKLVRDVLGDDLPAAEVARLLDRAAGNVFYLEELIRAYAEGTGRVPGRPNTMPPGTVPPPPTSSTALSADQAAWALPTTVLAMVEARLQRLDPMARRVLRAASIFGELFWRGGVLALTGGQYKASEIDDWLGELTRREIVQRRDSSRFPGDNEYAFRHAIVRDAAYQMLTNEDRSLGHRLAADWLERAGEHEPMLLGEHFERGGSRERAAVFYGRAAVQALEGNDFVAAKLRADRALQAGATGYEQGKLKLLLAEASRWSAEHEAARENARTAMQHLDIGTDEWYVAAAERVEAATTLGLADEVRGVTSILMDIVPVPASEITVAHVLATSRIAIALVLLGQYDDATTLLSRVSSAKELIEKEPAARAFLDAAGVAKAAWEGDLERAATLAQDAVVCFDLIGDVRNAARQRQKAGWAFCELGMYVLAESVLQDARDSAERLGLVSVANEAKLQLVTLYARTGRAEDAVRIGKEVIASFSAQLDRAGEGRARAYLAGVHYFANEHVEAEIEELRALPLLEHSPPYRAALMAFMTLTLIHKGASPDEIFIAGSEAMRLLEQMGGVGEGEGIIRIAYAEALYARGDIEGAKAAVMAARDRLLQRAAKIKNAEYKRCFLGVVREHVRTLARAGEWLL